LLTFRRIEEFPPSKVKAEARAAALQLLDGGWDGQLPVQPFQMARVLKIGIAKVNLNPDVAGYIERRDGRTCIYLNRGDSEWRQRFTCAHEIGHFVKNGDEDFAYLDHRDKLAQEGVDSEEIYANTFAATFLMPEEAVREFVDLDVGVKQMAAEFGVSKLAMETRLESLGLS
jgi:Zn-dependent peptidase ImmA (M78 family)